MLVRRERSKKEGYLQLRSYETAAEHVYEAKWRGKIHLLNDASLLKFLHSFKKF